MKTSPAGIRAHLRVVHIHSLLIGLAALFCSGCVASRTCVPNSYRQACAKVQPKVGISAQKDQLLSQYEGLISIGVNAGRQVSQSRVIKEANITPALVCNEVASQIGSQIPPPFQHAAGANAQLVLNVNITGYGWAVPTGGIAGIRMAPYRFYISGQVTINDAATGKKLLERSASAWTPIGNKPTAQNCINGLKPVAFDFARLCAGCLNEPE